MQRSTQRHDIREVEHTITVLASAEAVYQRLADVSNWPCLFPPTIYVHHLEHIRGEERIRIWATVGGEVRSWTSHRKLYPRSLRIDFRQEVPAPPMAAMGGAWLIEPLGDEECCVRLRHSYRAVGDDPASLEWIDQAVDRNSRSELAALKNHMEQVGASAGGLLMTFEDSVRVDGSAKNVYDFINEADRWADRLPHVAAVSLREDSPGLQMMKMETVTADGAVHTTESVRVCFPHHRIVYKQTTLPALLTLHCGSWQLNEDGQGLTVSSRHTVAINAGDSAESLGGDAGVQEARSLVRTALGGNSRITLGHAKQFAERRP